MDRIGQSKLDTKFELTLFSLFSLFFSLSLLSCSCLLLFHQIFASLFLNTIYCTLMTRSRVFPPRRGAQVPLNNTHFSLNTLYYFSFYIVLLFLFLFFSISLSSTFNVIFSLIFFFPFPFLSYLSPIFFLHFHSYIFTIIYFLIILSLIFLSHPF